MNVISKAFNINIPDELHKRLRRVAFELETTMTDITVEALLEKLPELEKRIKKKEKEKEI
ncbi:hypothetical protein [Desulfonema ishimotonii]|uniref:hypothetical protein n=1 Tax=Desulfonema ishimotonii TaxID=45657 RepID=UPI000F58B059|nr:hypothetical protein [Desulfonema ishimotonii]